MKVLFSGRWQVVLTHTDDVPEQGFEIAGSDQVDGFYVPGSTGTFDAEVSGEGWTIEMWARLPLNGSDWFTFDPVRATTYRPPHGLATRLSFDGDLTIFVGPFVLEQELLCISLDPEINPGFAVDPPDFTFEKG